MFDMATLEEEAGIDVDTGMEELNDLLPDFGREPSFQTVAQEFPEGLDENFLGLLPEIDEGAVASTPSTTKYRGAVPTVTPTIKKPKRKTQPRDAEGKLIQPSPRGRTGTSISSWRAITSGKWRCAWEEITGQSCEHKEFVWNNKKSAQSHVRSQHKVTGADPGAMSYLRRVEQQMTAAAYDHEDKNAAEQPVTHDIDNGISIEEKDAFDGLLGLKPLTSTY